jgi:hypothetical protein
MAAREKWWPDCNRLEAFIAGSKLKIEVLPADAP